MDWIRFLKKSARLKDKKIFEMWINNEINLDECLNEFRLNNKIPDRVYINILEFAIWLNGLGWIKYEID